MPGKLHPFGQKNKKKKGGRGRRRRMRMRMRRAFLFFEWYMKEMYMIFVHDANRLCLWSRFRFVPLVLWCTKRVSSWPVLFTLYIQLPPDITDRHSVLHRIFADDMKVYMSTDRSSIKFSAHCYAILCWWREIWTLVSSIDSMKTRQKPS